MSTTSPTVSEAARVFVTPSAYADAERFHEACTVLRREEPFAWVEADGFEPFWAVTRHADVYDIETRPGDFTNAPRSVLLDAETERQQQEAAPLRTLIHMDDPDHKAYRNLTSDWFLPRNLKRLDDRLRQLARASVDRMRELGDECDFARDIAMPYPLQVILAILGLPEDDYPRMLTLTQELFSGDDPELSRGTDPEDLVAVLTDFYNYFTQLTDDRRATPTEDLASVIANGDLGGEALGPMETLSYYVIIATAGHDTTASAMAGGMQALVEHPDQLARLQDDPDLLASAADEIIRWVTPVRHFMRNATGDHEVSGHRIEEGQSLLLSYPSANRDDHVFDDPFRFDVGRNPNRHLAFGFGAHYCLGARLAKMELQALFGELLPQLRSAELAGDPELTQSLFVGGLKHLPLRYELG